MNLSLHDGATITLQIERKPTQLLCSALQTLPLRHHCFLSPEKVVAPTSPSQDRKLQHGRCIPQSLQVLYLTTSAKILYGKMAQSKVPPSWSLSLLSPTSRYRPLSSVNLGKSLAVPSPWSRTPLQL